MRGSRVAFSSCVLTWQKAEERSPGLFYKSSVLIHEGSTLMTNHLLKGLITLEVRISV